MVFYKLYDRNDLTMVGSGNLSDFTIDYDYISNNASTAKITKPSSGFHGDIIAVTEGKNLLALGVVTAIDNSDLKITFKHAKELFNDNVLNVFKWTNLLNKKFDAVAGLKTIIEYAFVNTTDLKRKLPLQVRTFGEELNAVYTDDSDTINMLDFIDEMFDKHNIYLDFDIDFTNNKIMVTIAQNDTAGYVIKDNIKLSTPEFDNNELPKENKAILFNKTTGATAGTYYLLQDNTITTNQANVGRLWPPQTKYIAWDEVDAIKITIQWKILSAANFAGIFTAIAYNTALPKNRLWCGRQTFVLETK
jgi:hypothetical protein